MCNTFNSFLDQIIIISHLGRGKGPLKQVIKEIFMTLTAALGVSVASSKYLLVQFEDADEKIITPGDMYPKPEGKKQWQSSYYPYNDILCSIYLQK